jgi:hypothetical protein
MLRLSVKQLLFAIALGVLFASLQGEPPVHALANLSTVPCLSLKRS